MDAIKVSFLMQIHVLVLVMVHVKDVLMQILA